LSLFLSVSRGTIEIVVPAARAAGQKADMSPEAKR
jgi:hypothetical protein